MQSKPTEPSHARRVSLPGHRNLYYRPGSRPREYEIGFRDSSGKQRWERVGGDLKAALARRDEILGRIRRGEIVQPSAATFAEISSAWLESQAQLRPKTRENYSAHLRLHLLPRFGRRKLASITEDEVAQLIAELRSGRGPDGKARRPLGAWSIRGVLVVLSRVMSYAARRGMIAANPVSKLERGERPAVEPRERRVLEPDEIARLLAAASDKYRPIIAASVFLGVRQGEALALQWRDIDFDAGVVHVRGQLDRQRRRQSGKTAAARREVVLTPSLARLLRELRLRSRFTRDEDLVFCTSTGTALHYRNVVRRGLDAAFERAGIERMRWHDMRGTAVSAMIAAGLDPVFVSRQLGHSDPSITLKVYAHLYDRQRHADRARDALEACYGAALGGSAGEAPVQSDAVPPVPAPATKVVDMQAKRA